MMFHSKISRESGVKVIEEVCRVTGDEESEDRQKAFFDTYKQGFNGGDEVEGAPKLAELIAAKAEAIDVFTATLMLDDIKRLWRHGSGRKTTKDDNDDESCNSSEKTHGKPLASEIMKELDGMHWEYKRYNPDVLVVGHTRLNQLIDAKIDKYEKRKNPEDPNSELIEIPFLSPRNIYLNAIPIEIVKYEDPINITFGHRYRIKFKTSGNRVFTTEGASSLDSIIKDAVLLMRLVLFENWVKGCDEPNHQCIR